MQWTSFSKIKMLLSSDLHFKRRPVILTFSSDCWYFLNYSCEKTICNCQNCASHLLFRVSTLIRVNIPTTHQYAKDLAITSLGKIKQPTILSTARSVKFVTLHDMYTCLSGYPQKNAESCQENILYRSLIWDFSICMVGPQYFALQSLHCVSNIWDQIFHFLFQIS